MKLLDRYLLREMVVPFLIGQCAIVMMLTGTVLYNNANVLLQNQVPAVYVVRMVIFFLPFLVHMTMPVAMAVAASLAVSRLGRDSEITVMRASGCSLRRIFRPIFLTGLLVSIGDFYFGEYIVPPSVQNFDNVVAEMITHVPRLTPVSGQYIVSTDQSYVLYVKTMIPKQGYIELYGVQVIASPKIIYSGDAANIPLVVDAARGRFENGKWTLERPTIWGHRPGTRDALELVPRKDTQFTLYTAVDPQAFQSGFLLQLPMWSLARAATRNFSQLGEDIARNRQQGIHDLTVVLDYHFKLSIPFSCLVMAICCPPLALRYARGGGFMGTLLSICLVFVYWNTLLLTRILGSPGPQGIPPLLSPPVAAWSQNVIFVLLGLYVLWKSE